MTEGLSLVLLGIGLVLAFIRLIRGPSLASRIVAFDLMTMIGIGFMAVYAISTEEPVFLDVAIVLALVSFLGTIAFAYYLERTSR